MKCANAEIGITIRKIKTVVLIIFFSIVIIVRFLKFAANVGQGLAKYGYSVFRQARLTAVA